MKKEWKRRIIRRAQILLFSLIWLLVLQEAVPEKVEAFGLRPVIMETEIRRGSSKNFSVEVYPTRTTPEGVKIIVTDYIAKRDGTFDVTDIAEREIDPQAEPTLVLLSPTELHLEPGNEPVPFNFRVTVPPTVQSNEFIYVVLFESLNPEKADLNEETRLRLTHQIGMMMIIHVPGFRDIYNARVTEITHRFVDNRLFIVPTIENTGNRYIHLSGLCRIFDSAGHLVVTLPLMESQQRTSFLLAETPVFTGRMLDVPLEIMYPLAPGNYTADFRFNIRENEHALLRQSHNFSIEKAIDVAEIPARDLLRLQRESIRVEVAKGGSVRESLLLFNNYFEPLTLRLYADPGYVKITNFPVRINPGKERNIDFLVMNPGEDVIKTEIKIKLEEHDKELIVPVEIFTR